MNSTTSTRKTPSPVSARLATCSPQLAPMSWVEMAWSASTLTVSAITLVTLIA